jgi:hypothetical protein
MSERIVAQASVDEPFRECAQRRALARREPACAEDIRIGCEASAGDGRCPSKLCSRRDRIVRFVDPRARAEVGMRIDQPREDGVRVLEELARSGIGDRGRRLVVDHEHRRVLRREQMVGDRIADRVAGHQGCTWEP